MTAEKKEAFPLSWPSDWPRTRLADQRTIASWKRSANDYREELAKELDRRKAPIAIISTNVPLSVRGQMVAAATAGVRDVGVAIYFSMPMKEDFSWQDGLKIDSPAPTDDEINTAFKRLAAQYHPDKPGGGDREMFLALTRHRDNAFRWAHRMKAEPQHVIACDTFKEVRWNLAAIAFTLKYLRQIDRCGTSAVLERSFKSFLALAAAGDDVAVNS